MFFCGVDPGQSGAFVILDSKARLFYKSDFKSWRKLIKVLKNFDPLELVVCIEKVQSKSGQGVKSVFTFGKNYGGWLAVLELLGISHELVPPQRWQRTFLGTFPPGESKKRAVEFINRKFPNEDLTLKENGIADAYCLAMYALLQYRRLAGRV